MHLNSLNDLLLVQLHDLYDAELRLVDALPSLIDAAYNPDLKQALANHHQETQHHVQRLQQVFEELDVAVVRENCEAMKGLINEASEVIAADGDHAVKDAALIAAAQRVEHYEIAGYGTARAFAARLNLPRIAALLQETLDEEGTADKILTEIAEQDVNVHAQSV
jgi:ferritin-like metal-binding protein YciE